MNIDVSLINKRAPYHVNATDNINNLDFVTDYGVQYNQEFSLCGLEHEGLWCFRWFNVKSTIRIEKKTNSE